MRCQHIPKQYDVLSVLVCNMCGWIVQNNMRGRIRGAFKECKLRAAIGKLSLDLGMQRDMWRWLVPQKQPDMCSMHDASVRPWDICLELHQPGKSPVSELHGSTRKLLVG